MSSTNRAERIEQLYKSLKKYYKPTTIATDRPVLDLLLYSCCLEDAKFEAADEAFAKLQQSYFDWNEVRVTTVAELSEVLSSLPNPSSAAGRIKRCLQSLFESRFTFEIDDIRKANLGKTVSELESWPGVTKFAVAFVTQYALGGHAIPLCDASLETLKHLEIVSQSEAEKGVVPGLERAIAKAKGSEFGTILHQFSAEFRQNAKSTNPLAVFKELGVTPKPKPAPAPAKPAAKKVEASPKMESTSAKVGSKSSTSKTSDPPKKSAPAAPPLKPASESKKTAPEAKGLTPKEEALKPSVKKPDGKKIVETKAEPKKEEKKTETKKGEVKKVGELAAEAKGNTKPPVKKPSTPPKQEKKVPGKEATKKPAPTPPPVKKSSSAPKKGPTKSSASKSKPQSKKMITKKKPK